MNANSMLAEPFALHQYIVPLSCNYLLLIPEKLGSDTLGVIALHGYGSNAADMLRLTAMAAGRDHVIAALQAPNQHYADRPGVDAPAAYNWGIRQHWEDSIGMHHAMVKAVAGEVGGKFGFGPQRMVLMGFSQPVGLNYRFAGTQPEIFGGVIGICGGVPRDWEEPKYQAVRAAVLHISRDADEFYPVALAQEFPARLRAHAADVEFHMLPGGHRFPSKAAGIVRPWLGRVFR